MKRINGLAAAVVAMGLYAAPVGAVTGTLQGLPEGEVVCFNHATQATVTMPIQAGQFDCSDLAANPGDPITVVLVGAGEGGGGGGTCSSPVPEQEPNDARAPGQIQELAALQAGGCLAVTGSITTGVGDPNNPNPSADRDVYIFDLVGVSQLQVELVRVDSSVPFGFTVFDGQTGQPLPEQCPTLTGCVLTVSSPRVAVGVIAQSPASYTLNIADGSAGGMPFAAQAYSTPTDDNIFDSLDRLPNLR